MLPTKRSGPGILGNPSFRGRCLHGRCFPGSRPTDSPESRRADIAHSSPSGLAVRTGRLFAPALLILALSVALLLLPTAGAQSSGVPLPVAAGQTWQVASGYNTATHTGEDPHALDIVRVDAPTGGSALRSPVSGTVRYVSGDCLSVRDGLNRSHLLCHVFARQGLSRGTAVSQGDLLGTVAPAGFANNNGLSHIHYAIHNSFGGSSLQTVPFVGEYALEGRNLFDDGSFNQYSGLTIVSTNGMPDVGQPSLAPPPAPGSEPVFSPEVIALAQTEPDFLVPGWNLVGWGSDALVTVASASIADDARAFFTFDAATQTFRSYRPDGPPLINDLEALRKEAGIWVFVENADGAVWPRETTATPSAVNLVRGFNLVTWGPEQRDIQSAIAPLDGSVVGVWLWLPLERRFVIYRPDGPSFLNDLEELLAGPAMWIQMKSAAVWQQT